MLKARFEMVHVNQSKICILWWFGHWTWNIHERPGITNYLQPVVWTFNMVHVKQRKNCSILHFCKFWWFGPFDMEPSRDDQLFANICNMVFILLDLGLEALERNHFTKKQSVGKFGSLSFGLPNSPRFVGEKRIRCKMFHVNRPLSPNSPWKWRFFQKISGVNGKSGRGLFLYENQNHNFYKDAPLLK